jgi:hypothetical protein
MRTFVLSFALLAAAACGDDGESVTLSWAFGAGELGCEAAGVQTVHIFIGPLAPSGSYDQEVQCAAGEKGISVDGVSPGAHTLVLKALAKDKVLFELQQEIVVVAGHDMGRFVLPAYTPP